MSTAVAACEITNVGDKGIIVLDVKRAFSPDNAAI